MNDNIFENCSGTEYCFTNADDENLLLKLNTEKIQSSILVLCVLSAIIILGTIGNLLVLATYFKQLYKNSTNFFIFCLATLDLIGCVIFLPAEMLALLQPLTYHDPWLCKLNKFVGFSADLASGYTIVCISFDRYLRISRPHKRFSRQTCRRAVIFVVSTSVLISSMTIYAYGTEEVIIEGVPELLGYRCGITSVAKDTFIPLLFATIILVAFLIGVIILLTVYLRLGIIVRRWNKGRTRNAENKSATKTNGCSDDSSSKYDKKISNSKTETQPCETPLLIRDKSINHLKEKRRNNDRDTGIIKADVTKSTKQNDTAESSPSNRNFKIEAKVRKIPTKETFLTDTEISDADNNSVASLPVIRPGIVKELTNSLERNGFKVPDPSVHFDGTSTLPLRKAKQREISKRQISRKKSLLITDIKKRMTLSKTTIMFIVATVAFVACHVPYMCIKVAMVTAPGSEDTLSATETVFYRLAEYSFTVSYAVNPIIYSFLNSRFRKECGKLIVTLLKKITCRYRVVWI